MVSEWVEEIKFEFEDKTASSPLMAVICAVRLGGSAVMASLAAFLYSRSSFSMDLSCAGAVFVMGVFSEFVGVKVGADERLVHPNVQTGVYHRDFVFVLYGSESEYHLCICCFHFEDLFPL